MVGAAILIWEGLFVIVVAAVAALALVVVLDNVRELRWGSAPPDDATTPSAVAAVLRTAGLRDPGSDDAHRPGRSGRPRSPSTTTAATSGTASRTRPRPSAGLDPVDAVARRDEDQADAAHDRGHAQPEGDDKDQPERRPACRDRTRAGSAARSSTG